MGSDILLVTLNATYQHAAFGLRYLRANLGPNQNRSEIIEFTIAQKPRDIAETLLERCPRIIGFGVYIWNTEPTRQVIEILKKVAPEIVIVVGGPEVSYEIETQAIFGLADHILPGEAELTFRDLCHDILTHGATTKPKVVRGPLPDLDKMAEPYSLYTDEDIRNRFIYVEASRGCPYRCEFCLSSLDEKVRNFPLERFLNSIENLISRGARQFKFVDRTFNLSPQVSTAILDFFLKRMDLGLFLHFELVPDRLPEALKDRIRAFPPGSLQFEIGIQTWSPEVAKNISRRQDYQKVGENFQFLIDQTHVHIHADLIVGLPGETLESFRSGFDALSAMHPHEIQVGVLKRLKGTPISRHDVAWKMIYQNDPPFTVLSTKTMPFSTITSLERFAKFHDLVVNNHQFPECVRWLKEFSQRSEPASWFDEFFKLSQFLYTRHPQRHSISLVNLAHSLWLYLSCHPLGNEDLATTAIIKDYCGDKKRDIPLFLKQRAGHASGTFHESNRSTPSRQKRFLEALSAVQSHA